MEAEAQAKDPQPAARQPGDSPTAGAKADTKSDTMTQAMKWVGYLTALIGLGGSLAAGIHWYQQRQQHQAEFASRMAASQALLNDGEYQASIESYNVILKDDPLDKAALDAQLKATMRWEETFVPIVQAGKNPADAAGPQVDSMLAILNAGLARSSGRSAADIQAHIGWAHWLKQHVAEQEFGSAAKDNFTAALKTDPANVYAHAMLGNYMLMTGEEIKDALPHLIAAVATQKERPLVRHLQLNGLFGREQDTGVRAEIMRVANDMRKAGEPLSQRGKTSVIQICFDPPFTKADDLREALTALPRDDTWQTFLWLDSLQKEGSYLEAQQFTRAYIEATLDELTGDKAQALTRFKALQSAIKGKSSSFESPVEEAVKRLSNA